MMVDLRGSFSKAQRATLLKPIMTHRVSKDGKGFSHLESFEVKAHLCRLFGFEGWSTQIDSLTCIFEDYIEWKTGDGQLRSGWDVAYLCSMTLSVFSEDGVLVKQSSDAATDSAIHQKTRADAHDLAVKSAVSGALKRCATALGDQFGLSLYAKGSMEPLVKRVIPYEEVQNDHQESLL